MKSGKRYLERTASGWSHSGSVPGCWVADVNGRAITDCRRCHYAACGRSREGGLPTEARCPTFLVGASRVVCSAGRWRRFSSESLIFDSRSVDRERRRAIDATVPRRRRRRGGSHLSVELISAGTGRDALEPPLKSGLPRPDRWRRWLPDSSDDGDGWLPLTEYGRAPKSSGVYCVRSKRNGQIQVISRADGRDSDGLIYVGKTGGRLRRRLASFVACAQPGARSGNHVAGNNYRTKNYSRLFPLEGLEFCCIEESGAEQRSDLEADILCQYLRSFLDLPPLNFALPRPVLRRMGVTPERED